MERITGSDALGLIEAYNNVYAPQELTEEQVWEEVENWVNSLVEEGYDLSEYTWEDMYEEYISEIPINPGGNRPISNAPYQSRFARPMNAGTPQQTGRGTAVSRPQIGGLGGLGVGYRGAELQQAARARASQVGTPRQGTAGGPTTGGNTPIRPAATARPAAQAPARPATAPAGIPKPAPAPVPNLPGLSGTGALNAPARQSLAQQRVELQKLRLASQMRQAGQNVVSTQLAHFDPFDVVLGHLIDEGYADTEESALQIMANMSEEWREDILDEGFKRMNRGKIEKQAQRLGGDKGDVLRAVAAKMDTEDERKYSTRQSRRNKAGGAGSEYRKGKELQARDDAKSDIEKYGFH